MQRKLKYSKGTTVLLWHSASAASTHPAKVAFARSKKNQSVIAGILLVALVAATLCALSGSPSTNKVSAKNKETTTNTSEYQYLMTSFRPVNSPIGPIRLSELHQDVLSRFEDYNMRLEGVSDFVSYGISKTQVPNQAQPFMQYHGEKKGWSNTWSTDLVNALIQTDSNGEDISCIDYPRSASQVRMALEAVSVSLEKDSKSNIPIRVLVAGSISPWVEALVLNSNLSLAGGKVYVTDYNSLVIEDPRIEFISMDELKKNTSSPAFDIIVTYSSIEHDGLGRYGDPINPSGDMAAMAEFHSMMKEDGFLIFAVPVVASNSFVGSIYSNWHRIYSMARLEKLWCGFDVVGEQIDPPGMELVDGDRTVKVDWKYQPIFVLKRSKEVDCYLDILKDQIGETKEADT